MKESLLNGGSHGAGALLPAGTRFLLSQGFFPLSLDGIIKREADLEEGSHTLPRPAHKKRGGGGPCPNLHISSAEGVAMTTFWRLSSVSGI